MLAANRTRPRSSMLAAELRDALGRRQKELPSRWLLPVIAGQAQTIPPTISGEWRDAESRLACQAVERLVDHTLPRAVVCLHASASRATSRVLAAVRARRSIVDVAVVEADPMLARAVARQLTGDGEREIAPLTADSTLDLALPDHFPRPRVYLSLGNSLGATTAVGAVRTLRVLRSTMTPGDAVVFGLVTDVPVADDSTVSSDDAERHFGALRRINETFGSGFDPSRFQCRSRYDAESKRREVHLVAREAVETEIPGVGEVRLRKGETIRTAVSCSFDRARFGAMLGGVGLALQSWECHPSGRLAVAVASPAI